MRALNCRLSLRKRKRIPAANRFNGRVTMLCERSAGLHGGRRTGTSSTSINFNNLRNNGKCNAKNTKWTQFILINYCIHLTSTRLSSIFLLCRTFSSLDSSCYSSPSRTAIGMKNARANGSAALFFAAALSHSAGIIFIIVASGRRRSCHSL